MYEEFLLDFVKLIEFYGYVGIKVIKFEQLDEVMEWVFVLKDCLVFLDINVDFNEYVYFMQIKEGFMCDMWFSKMECI